MNIASIDIGSNTALLLIVNIGDDKKIKPLHNEYLSPRLGEGLLPDCGILPNPQNKLFSALKYYKELIDKYNCKKVFVNATNAMRVATNGEEIANKIKLNFGFDVNIISGEREAELSFLGASSIIESVENRVVIDIGGGSTEVIIGSKDEILFRKSHKIGTVSLTEKFISKYPVAKNEQEKIENEIIDTFSGIKATGLKCKHAISVAGTPTTLSCINVGAKRFVESDVEGSNLSIADLTRISGELANLTPTEVIQKYGEVVEGRADVIFAGSLILKNLLKILAVDSTIVSSKGLRYGIIEEYVKTL